MSKSSDSSTSSSEELFGDKFDSFILNQGYDVEAHQTPAEAPTESPILTMRSRNDDSDTSAEDSSKILKDLPEPKSNENINRSKSKGKIDYSKQAKSLSGRQGSFWPRKISEFFSISQKRPASPPPQRQEAPQHNIARAAQNTSSSQHNTNNHQPASSHFKKESSGSVSSKESIARTSKNTSPSPTKKKSSSPTGSILKNTDQPKRQGPSLIERSLSLKLINKKKLADDEPSQLAPSQGLFRLPLVRSKSSKIPKMPDQAETQKNQKELSTKEDSAGSDSNQAPLPLCKDQPKETKRSAEVIIPMESVSVSEDEHGQSFEELPLSDDNSDEESTSHLSLPQRLALERQRRKKLQSQLTNIANTIGQYKSLMEQELEEERTNVYELQEKLQKVVKTFNDEIEEKNEEIYNLKQSKQSTVEEHMKTMKSILKEIVELEEVQDLKDKQTEELQEQVNFLREENNSLTEKLRESAILENNDADPRTRIGEYARLILQLSGQLPADYAPPAPQQKPFTNSNSFLFLNSGNIPSNGSASNIPTGTTEEIKFKVKYVQLEQKYKELNQLQEETMKMYNDSKVELQQATRIIKGYKGTVEQLRKDITELNTQNEILIIENEGLHNNMLPQPTLPTGYSRKQPSRASSFNGPQAKKQQALLSTSDAFLRTTLQQTGTSEKIISRMVDAKIISEDDPNVLFNKISNRLNKHDPTQRNSPRPVPQDTNDSESNWFVALLEDLDPQSQEDEDDNSSFMGNALQSPTSQGLEKFLSSILPPARALPTPESPNSFEPHQATGHSREVTEFQSALGPREASDSQSTLGPNQAAQTNSQSLQANHQDSQESHQTPRDSNQNILQSPKENSTQKSPRGLEIKDSPRSTKDSPRSTKDSPRSAKDSPRLAQNETDSARPQNKRSQSPLAATASKTEHETEETQNPNK